MSATPQRVKQHATGTKEPASCATVRVLSYNLNILGRGCGGFQSERIATFLDAVDGYDVLLLQEVYASSVLPYVAQHHLCYQASLLAGLKEKGFEHYVVGRQPSYATMLKYGITSDSGLIIASRFPIVRRGSYTFRTRRQVEQNSAKGCLMAEIEIPGACDDRCAYVVFFNVHMRPEQSDVYESTQVDQLRSFVYTVLHNIAHGTDSRGRDEGPTGEATCTRSTPRRRPPFVIAGDFNIQGIEPSTNQPSQSWLSCVAALQQQLGLVHEVVLESAGHQPPTRPAHLFFPTRSKLTHYDNVPMRQDYFITGTDLTARDTRIEKFVVGHYRPYTYLSDHFGIATTLVTKATTRAGHGIAAANKSDWMGMTNHERSNPATGKELKVLVLLGMLLCWFAYAVTAKPLLVVLLLWLALRQVPVLRRLLLVQADTPVLQPRVLAQRDRRASDVITKASDAIQGDALLQPTCASLAQLWQSAQHVYGERRCLGALDATGVPQWQSYATVDRRARAVGAGLVRLGLQPGDLVAVEADGGRNVALLDLACALYGFATLPVAGKGATVRALLDQNKTRIAFADRTGLPALLMCRSTRLETVVCLHDTPDVEAVAMAKDLCITLLAFDQLEQDGWLNAIAPATPAPTSETVLSYTMDNISSSDYTKLIPITHADVLRDVATLYVTGAMPNTTASGAATHAVQTMVWCTPFAILFNRICVWAMLGRGNGVATAGSLQLQTALMRFRPTLLVAAPSQFAMSRLQQLRAQRGHDRALYNKLFQTVFRLQARLMRVCGVSVRPLRYLFFRSFRLQLGGAVAHILLAVSQESTAPELLEHIAVCYTPHLHEVSFQNGIGICTVDGVPAPQLDVELRPMDVLAQNANIGQLALRRQGQAIGVIDVVARWADRRTLTLLGSSLGVLWPTPERYAVAASLERVFANSRYVSDVFVYCAPCKSVIAIVHPNRDTVEFEWRNSAANSASDDTHPSEPPSPSLGWNELVAYATPLILADLRAIAAEEQLPVEHAPRHVHLHPHAFRSHNNFVTPFGKIRREPVWQYFGAVIDRLYHGDASHAGSGNHATAPQPLPEATTSASPMGSTVFAGGNAAHSRSFSSSLLETSAGSDTDASVTSLTQMWQAGQPRLRLRVPVAVDIGGTLAKFAYVVPPNLRDLPPFSPLLNEPSSLSDRIGLRSLAFFADAAAAEKELQQQPNSHVGLLRFGKIPTTHLPRFVDYLASVHATSMYKPAFMRRVRATGGGAFKYAGLVHDALGLDFDVVKEMDAVVKGLNLILRLAPDSIFTVEPGTGRHLPHRLHSTGDHLAPFPYLLVNIGSGISIIKCTGADGAHVRVGGSPIGGATFWGLTRTMTSLTSWDEVSEIMRLDGPGDNKNVDLLVGDIYGFNAKDLPPMLQAETVASSFGRLGTERFNGAIKSPVEHFADDEPGRISAAPASDGTPRGHTTGEVVNRALTAARHRNASSIDIVRSLLNMIAGNVTQLAYLHSKVHGIKNVFFAGGFVRNNAIIWSLISATLQYWSSGECHAHFLEHDGYLCALGCAVAEADDGDKADGE